MSDTRTYDPEQVTVTWGPFEIEGFMDGSPIEAERAEDGVTTHVGLKGNVTRIKNKNKMGDVTITLTQVSSSNDDLSTAATLDEDTNPGVVHPLTVKDHNGTTNVFAAEAWVKKIPKLERGKDLAGVGWVFSCAKLKPFVGGQQT
jgi:hypothetical protein